MIHDIKKNEFCYYCTRCSTASGDGDGLVGQECKPMNTPNSHEPKRELDSDYLQSELKSACCNAEKDVYPPDFNGNKEVCKSCHKPFISASDKENIIPWAVKCLDCNIDAHCNQKNCACDICNPTESPDWMEEFDEKFYWVSRSDNGRKSIEVYLMPDKVPSSRMPSIIKSFIASKIEAARSMTSKLYIEETRKAVEIALEQGRQEEKARMVTVIEELENHTWQSNTRTVEKIKEYLKSDE